jgi:hypothetical protein
VPTGIRPRQHLQTHFAFMNPESSPSLRRQRKVKACPTFCGTGTSWPLLRNRDDVAATASAGQRERIRASPALIPFSCVWALLNARLHFSVVHFTHLITLQIKPQLLVWSTIMAVTTMYKLHSA